MPEDRDYPAHSDPAETRQHLAAMPQVGDDDLVALTGLQAHKCAAILDAYLDGQLLHHDNARTVTALLRALAFGAGGVTIVPTSAQAWARLQAAPWPAPGPVPQPDL